MTSLERWNLRRVFRLPSTDQRLSDDVDAELEFHIRGRIEELMAQGLSHDDAAREARSRFGDFSRIQKEVGDVSRRAERRHTLAERLSGLAGDARYVARSLLKQPVFSVVVVLTMTLGIGAAAAMYHAVDRVVLRPLPYADPDAIVYLGTRWGKGMPTGALPPGRFQFWHDHSRVFDGLAAYTDFDATLGNDEGIVPAVAVTPDFFHVLHATTLLGRGLAARDYAPAAPPVAVLGRGLWLTRFGGDPNVIGHTIRLNDTTYTIVGVMPASFEIAELPAPPGVLVPLVFSQAQLAEKGANYTAVGRLAPGISAARISADMASVFARFHEAFPDFVDGNDFGVGVMTYEDIFGGSVVSQLWIMLGATAFVFLLACANVANVVYARALTRRREFAVRAALGAGRARIARQVVLEMLLLGTISAVAATAASVATLRGLVALANRSLMRESQLHLDARVVFVTMLVALAASLVIGVVVALSATRSADARALAASARTGGVGGGRRTREILVGLESALAMVLLAGAALLISSFVRVLRVDGGFRREGVYTATISHPPLDYRDVDALHRFEQRVLDALHSTPGIASGGATASLPLVRGLNLPTTVEGKSDLTEGATEWRAVSPGYFGMMDIHLLAGRDINASDVATSPPVVLVSTAYVKRFFPGENPIGRRILIGCYKGCPGREAKAAAQIVGIVPDLRDQSLEQSTPRHTIWVPLAQGGGGFAGMPAFVVRATDPSVAASALRRAIDDADPRMGVPDIAAMSDIVTASVSWRRFSMVLMICFAALALALTCVGIYGVASYAVSQRTQEIGIRMALGARPRAVVGLVVRQGVRPAAIGLVAGLVLALLLSKVLAKLLFGVGPRDPISFASVALVLLVVAVAASYFPARRAARVDPARALRLE